MSQTSCTRPLKKIRLIVGGDDCISSDETDLCADLVSKGMDCQIVNWNICDIDPDATYVFRSCWDYHLKLDAFKEFLERLKNLNVKTLNNLDVVCWNMDKMYLLDMEQAGCRIPKTFYCATISDIQKVKEYFSVWNGALIIKPAISASAHGIKKIEDSNQITLIDNKPTLVQEYLPQVENSGEQSLVFFNGKFSHAILKKPAQGDYRVQGRHGGSQELYKPNVATLSAAKNVLDVLVEKFGHVPCYSRVDMIEDDRSPLLMELELIEPYLSLKLHPPAVSKLSQDIVTLAL